jgi:hypothetical protein
MTKLTPEELRRRGAELKAGKQSAVGPPAPSKPPPKPAGRKPPPPPTVSTETVIVACGHTAVFPLFADKQDKYRAERRKKLVSKPCAECRQVAAAAEVARQKAQRAERLKKEAAWITMSGRLPDASKFEVVYDATRETWTGVLSVVGQKFLGEHSGVFGLLRTLDRMYWSWKQKADSEDSAGSSQKTEEEKHHESDNA